MSVTILGTALLAVSFISVLIYMTALGQLLTGPHRPGLVRTGVCRLFAALLYVGVALATLAEHSGGPLFGLGVFTVVQLMWQANSIADVRLTREMRAEYVTEETPGVRAPIPNYIAPLGETVVAAEIDRLSAEVGKIKNDRLTPLEDTINSMQAVRRYYWGLSIFSLIIGVMGLAFGLVVYNRADDAQVLSQENSRIIAQLQAVQTREDATVHSFCGLYDAFLGFYNTRAKNAFPDGAAAYDDLFRKLYAQSNGITCNLRSPAGLGG